VVVCWLRTPLRTPLGYGLATRTDHITQIKRPHYPILVICPQIGNQCVRLNWQNSVSNGSEKANGYSSGSILSTLSSCSVGASLIGLCFIWPMRAVHYLRMKSNSSSGAKLVSSARASGFRCRQRPLADGRTPINGLAKQRTQRHPNGVTTRVAYTAFANHRFACLLQRQPCCTVTCATNQWRTHRC